MKKLVLLFAATLMTAFLLAQQPQFTADSSCYCYAKTTLNKTIHDGTTPVVVILQGADIHNALVASYCIDQKVEMVGYMGQYKWNELLTVVPIDVDLFKTYLLANTWNMVLKHKCPTCNYD